MPIQTSFNAGEFSDLLDGSINLDKHRYSVKTLQNMIALKQGPAVRRGPTIFVNEIKDSTKRTQLLRFETSDSQSYVLEFGNQYIRFYKNYTYLGYELATPYVQADLFDSNNLFQIQVAQSGDVLYLVHQKYVPQVLTRINDTSWSIGELDIQDGPYLDVNVTTTTLGLSGTSGSVTVTASASLFASTDVGRLIRWKDPANNWTWLEITAYTSATVVTATIRGANASATTATVDWRFGVYSATTGYPRAISFFQDRLAFAGSTSYPDRYDLTKTGGYSATFVTFQPTNAAGAVADDNAITGNVPSGQVNAINWLASDLRGLIAGTVKEEFVIRSNSLGDAITPSNASSSLFSGTGSSYIQPVRTVDGTTFVQTARRRLFDVVYSFEQDSLRPKDLTLAAEHITRSQIIAITYQQEPINVVWAVRNDGILVGMTHYPEQDVYGWHRHQIGGVSDEDGTNAIVESVTTIPSPDGSRDDLWLIIRRRINGNTVRYIEYMRRYYEDDQDVEDAGCCDSRFTYDGAVTSTVSGLDHLEGETVKVMVDGLSHPNLVVSGGAVTLANNRTGSVIQIGLSYTWRIITQKIDTVLPNNDTGQGRKKRIINIIVRMLNSLGMKYGTPQGSLIEHDFNQGASYDTATPLFTGDTIELNWPGGDETAGQILLENDSVFPVCIVALISEVKTKS